MATIMIMLIMMSGQHPKKKKLLNCGTTRHQRLLVLSFFGFVAPQDKPIMEFNSANKAYEYGPSEGFRTFLKIYRGDGQPTFLEPFSPKDGTRGRSASRTMLVGMNELEIQVRCSRD